MHTKKTINLLWKDLTELVEDQDHCDEDNDNQEGEVIDLMDHHGVNLDMSRPEVKIFFQRLHWATSEMYNSEYACEAPGSRTSHHKGYKDAMKEAKALLQNIFGVV